MSECIRKHDWAATSLGAPQTWPQSLCTALSIVLSSAFATCLVWGPELTSFYNDAYLPIMGDKPNGIGRPFAEVWSEVWDTIGPIIERAMKGQASYFEDLPITLTRRGFPEETWFSFSYSPIRDETGGIGGVLCIAHEATRRVRAEASLRESEERFCRFAENSSNALWIFDLETMHFEYLSPAFDSMWGERRERVLRDAARWSLSLHPDDRQRASDTLERVALGEICTEEFRIVRQDGAVRWIRNTSFPMSDEKGRIRRAGGVAQDISRDEGRFVYLVETEPATSRGTTNLLRDVGYRVRAFSSGKAFLEAAPGLMPGCVLLDVCRSGAKGLGVPSDLRARRIGLPTIVLGDADFSVGFVVQAMRAGAVDYLPVPYTSEQLLAAVASAVANAPEDGAGDNGAKSRNRLSDLSQREREVLSGLVAGKTNKEIARTMALSPRTVEAHRARVMQRIGAKTLSQAVLLATAAGVSAVDTEPKVG